MMRSKLFLIISSVITLLFVVAITIDLSPYLRGPAPYYPDWRWEYNFVNTYPKIWAPILAAVTILFLFVKVEKNKKWLQKYKVRVLLSFAVLSLIFQYALLFANRAGVNGLLSRIIHPGVNGYFTTATQITSISAFLNSYNQNVLSFSMHAQGHPPLAILFFYWISEFFKIFSFLNSYVERISPSTQSINLIWMNLSSNEKMGALFATFFIPLIVCFSSIVLYFLAEKLYDSKIALRTFVTYLFVPSVLLFIPINDVFISIFPLISLLILLRSMKEKNASLTILSGFVFSIGIYFSISLLPLALISVVFIITKLNLKTKIIVKFLLYFLSGNMLIPIFLWLLFKFDSIQMIQILMKGLPESRNYTTWVFYNLYDFFIFTGIPLTIVFVLLFISQTRSILNRKFKKVDVLFVSFTLMLFIVNFSGSVRGEVARIWLPFVPFYILPLINFLDKKGFATKHFVLLFALQLFIILAINEYWVTFW